MLFLNLGLPIHPTEVLNLDEDTCSDLVNRFGRNLERLRSLHVEQISKVLRGAKKGGHIRWHILATEQTDISSNFRGSCRNIYYVLVGLEEPGLGVVPNVLDETTLRKLVQALGVDFDEIRKLRRDQVVWVLKWLQEAGMVECSEVQHDQAPVKVNPPELLGNHNTDLSQCTPPSVDPSLLTSDRTLSDPANFPPYAGAQFDLEWKQCMASQEEQNTAEYPCLEPVATPVGAVTSPESDLDTLFYLTPDANASSYPTPSTCYANSPPADESLPPLGPYISTQAKFQLLRLCRFGKDGTQLLEESRIPPILKAEARLLAQDLRLLQPFLGRIQADTLPSLNALGLPVEWMGKEGAVNYYRVLEAEKQNMLILDPLAKRIAQLLFYLNYRWLGKHVKRGRASVATLILNACPEKPNIPELMKSRRDNITGYHVRRGKYCWTLAACLGAGILVHAGNTIDAIINSTFTIDQLNVFISFVLRTRPGSVYLFHSLEPVINAFMLGMAAVDLRPIILASNTDIIRQQELACAYAADQEALANQQTEETWLARDAESIAEEKISEFYPDF